MKKIKDNAAIGDLAHVATPLFYADLQGQDGDVRWQDSKGEEDASKLEKKRSVGKCSKMAVDRLVEEMACIGKGDYTVQNGTMNVSSGGDMLCQVGKVQNV